MTESQAKPAIAAVNELFGKSPDGLREIVRAVVQEMLEAEMTDALGAGKGERTSARVGYRSGYYTRTLVTRVGKLELRVPQDRDRRLRRVERGGCLRRGGRRRGVGQLQPNAVAARLAPNPALRRERQWRAEHHAFAQPDPVKLAMRTVGG